MRVGDDGGEVRDGGKAVALAHVELLVVGEQEAVGGVLQHALLHAAVVNRGGQHAARLEVDAAGAHEGLREQQGFEQADGGGAGEAVELHVEVAARGQRGDLGVAGQAGEDVDHVGGDDEALVALGNEVGEVEVGARDAEEHRVAVVNLEVCAQGDVLAAGVVGLLGAGYGLGDRRVRGRRGVALLDLEGAAVLATDEVLLLQDLEVLANAVHAHAESLREVLYGGKARGVHDAHDLSAAFFREQGSLRLHGWPKAPTYGQYKCSVFSKL